MAPDYAKPPINIAGSPLFLSIAPKLAEYIDPEGLLDQLTYAYYTYEGGRFNINTGDLDAAFTWFATCQGEKFWCALNELCHGQIDGALESLQELMDEDD